MADVLTPKVRSVENMVQRARGATQKSSSPACPVCHLKAWVSLFFDGTGNHRERDFPKCHSNVAALFDAHQDKPDEGIIRLYYEGLGRSFSFRERYEETKVFTRGGVRTIKTEGYEEADDRGMGKGFADGITERLEKALFELTDQIERLRGKLNVDEINLAVFGFSSGSTEARAFLHWMAAHSKVKKAGTKLTYDDVPLNVKFLGIFDTVESVGWAGSNKMPELIKTKVPAFVEKCTHIVAAHELRDAFPLTQVDRTHRCVVYPGAHSDIGGGYEPDEQGRSNQLARIALLQMLDEARGAGLKMMSLGEMKASDEWNKKYRHSFDVPAAAQKSLNDYLAAVKPSGAMTQHFQAHMDHYWRWIDSGLAMEDVEQKRQAFKGNKDREADFRIMKHLLTFTARTPEGRGQGKTLAKREGIPAPVESFFKTYVHDSFEHFSATGGTLQKDTSTADYYHLRTVVQPAG
jgi:uncharacterized protein (DUF2235 family)